MDKLLWLIPVLPLAGFLINGLVGKRLPEKVVAAIACLLPTGSFVLAFLSYLRVRSDGAFGQEVFTWIAAGDATLNFALQVDHLTAVMLLVVTGVGSLIHFYSIGYMHGDKGFARYFAYLNLFMFAMLLLVTGDNLAVMFVGWEGVGLCSYLLIGFWFDDPQKADAGKKAFIVNRVGDLGFLLGMFTLFAAFGSLNFETLASKATTGTIGGGLFEGWEIGSVLQLAAIFLFVGATGKSAQIPLYIWLPDAMAGPTPVSALIHAATMVTAGVYMVARMGFAYAMAPYALLVVAAVGCLTALVAGIIAVCQNDIKKVLAYSTVSQLGFMFMGVGSGYFFAGIFHLMTHAYFKACLFLGSGSVIHGMHGEQDIRKMGGLFPKMRITAITFIIASAALAGLPFVTAGFYSKEMILGAVWGSEAIAGTALPWAGKAIAIAGFLAAGLTAFYMTRLVLMTFFWERKWEEDEDHKGPHESPPTMTVPLVILAVLSLIGGCAWFFDVGSWLGHEQAEYVHHHTPGAFVALSFVVSLGGIGMGWFFYGMMRELPGRIAGSAKWVYELVLNKFYVDELYELTIVIPVRMGATAVWFVFDRILIDTILVHGAGKIVRWGALGARLFHRGALTGATAGILAGAVAAVGYLAWKLLNHG